MKQGKIESFSERFEVPVLHVVGNLMGGDQVLRLDRHSFERRKWSYQMEKVQKGDPKTNKGGQTVTLILVTIRYREQDSAM